MYFICILGYYPPMRNYYWEEFVRDVVGICRTEQGYYLDRIYPWPHWCVV